MPKPSQKAIAVSATVVAVVAAGSIATTALVRSCSNADGTTDGTVVTEKADATDDEKATAGDGTADEEKATDAKVTENPAEPADEPDDKKQDAPADGQDDQDGEKDGKKDGQDGEKDGKKDGEDGNKEPSGDEKPPDVEFSVAEAGPDDPAILIDDDMFRIEIADRHLTDKRGFSGYAKLLMTNKTDRILGLRFLGDWTRGDEHHSNPLTLDPNWEDGHLVDPDVDAIWGYAPGQTREIWVITDLVRDNLPETGSIGMEGTIEAYEGIGSPDDYDAEYKYEFVGEEEKIPRRSYHLSF